MIAIPPGLILLLAALFGSADRAAAAPCADVALVLAVDSSGSIDDGEFALQLDGFAAAFRHPVVLDAIALTGRVDLAAVFWGDPGAPVQIVPWHMIESRADAARFADRLATMPRHTYGGTGLGNGVQAALNLLSDPSRCALRSVINVSGDGRATTSKAIQRAAPPGATNQETLLAHANRLAGRRGVTINGLDDHRRRPGPHGLLPAERHHRPRQLRDGDRDARRFRRPPSSRSCAARSGRWWFPRPLSPSRARRKAEAPPARAARSDPRQQLRLSSPRTRHRSECPLRADSASRSRAWRTRPLPPLPRWQPPAPFPRGRAKPISLPPPLSTTLSAPSPALDPAYHRQIRQPHQPALAREAQRPVAALLLRHARNHVIAGIVDRDRPADIHRQPPRCRKETVAQIVLRPARRRNPEIARPPVRA